MNKQKKADKKTILMRIGLSLLAAVPLPLTLLISVPFEVYGANFAQYVFTLGDFFPVCVGFFFLAVAVLFAAVFFLPKRAFRIVCSILITLALMCFVQGNYLNGQLDSLGGDYLEGEGISAVSAWLNAVIWIAVVAVGIVLACLKDRKNIISFVGVVLAVIVLATQVVAPIFVAATNGEMYDKQADNAVHTERYILTDANVRTAATRSNIYWFIIDRFDETFAEEAYNQQPQVFDNLEGFTWFQAHLACYSQTFPAIAHMLTCNEYDPHMMRASWLRESYKKPLPLNELHNNGYSVHLYTQQYYSFDDAKDLPDYVANRALSASYQVSDRVQLAFSVVGVGLYRELPYLAKRVIHLDSSTSNNFIEESDADGNAKYSCYGLPDGQFDSAEDKAFYFIHKDGCHAATTAKAGARLALENFAYIQKYIDNLKAKGLYDNATIIITGDHALADVLGGAYYDSPQLTALFVKPSGATNARLVKSVAPTSHENLWATVFKSAGITPSQDFNYGRSVFDIPEDDPVVRYTVSHTYSRELLAVRYKVVGDARNFDNWSIEEELHLNKQLTD